MSKKKIVLLSVAILFCIGIVVVVSAMFRYEDISYTEPSAEEVEQNLAKMSDLSPLELASSNPFDYINNEYYENIVSMGMPAVEVLEDKYHNGELGGLNAYIAGLAIMDITGLNLYKCTGDDWGNAEEFFERWSEIVDTLPETFYGIINSDTALDEKIDRIEKYGVFGQEFLNSICMENDDIINYFGESVSVDEALKAKVQNVSKLSANEMKQVEAYLELHID